jgi:hypothetical protein
VKQRGTTQRSRERIHINEGEQASGEKKHRRIEE